jgi:uncharacterized membrane protein
MSKDTASRAFFPGYVVPALLGVIVLVNLAWWRVYWPMKGGTLTTYSDRWRVSGTILLKVGIAVGLYAWYVLANDASKERFALPILRISTVVAMLGLCLFAYGFSG